MFIEKMRRSKWGIRFVLFAFVFLPSVVAADVGPQLTPADFDLSGDPFFVAAYKLLFTPRYFEPHWEHFVFDPALMWSLVASNVLTMIAYTLIPIALIYFIRVRRLEKFSPIFLLFGAFIILCGLHHAVHVLTFWYPVYHLQNIVDITTGVVSILTFFALLRVLPEAIKLRSPRV